LGGKAKSKKKEKDVGVAEGYRRAGFLGEGLKEHGVQKMLPR